MGIIRQGLSKKGSFSQKFLIPLGLKNPIDSYNEIHKDDVVNLPIDPSDQFSLIMVAGTGYGKSRLFKRALPYLANEQGFNSLLFDCKGFEMYHAKYRTKEWDCLLPWEDPQSVDLNCYMPAFVRKKARENALYDSVPYLKSFDTFAYNFEDISDTMEAKTLGISSRARMAFMEKIKPWLKENPSSSDKEVINKINSLKIPYASKQNLIQVYDYSTSEDLFDREESKLNVKNDWRNDRTPMISLLEPDEESGSFYVGKILAELYEKNVMDKSNKLLTIDDAHKVVGRNMKEDDYLSVKKIMDTLTLGRWKKWHTWFMTQSFQLLNKNLFPHMKYKIIGKLGSKDIKYLQNFCSPGVIRAAKSLRYDPVRQIKEFMLIFPDNMRYQKFFALGPLCKHL